MALSRPVPSPQTPAKPKFGRISLAAYWGLPTEDWKLTPTLDSRLPSVQIVCHAGKSRLPYSPRAHPMTAPSDRPLAARLADALGDAYTIEGEIGRGGMGVVYRARDERLQRRVAIKVLPPELAFQQDIRQRFTREAQTAARLSHPHIVPIHSVGEGQGLVYFVMGYVDGESRRRPDPPAGTAPGRGSPPDHEGNAPTRSAPPMPSQSFTATSSPTTSCSKAPGAGSWSPTSASPRRSRPPQARR